MGALGWAQVLAQSGGGLGRAHLLSSGVRYLLFILGRPPSASLSNAAKKDGKRVAYLYQKQDEHLPKASPGKNWDTEGGDILSPCVTHPRVWGGATHSSSICYRAVGGVGDSPGWLRRGETKVAGWAGMWPGVGQTPTSQFEPVERLVRYKRQLDGGESRTDTL